MAVPTAAPTVAPTATPTVKPTPTAEPTATAKPTAKPHKHSWSEWKVTKEATCTDEGKMTRTCACGEKETKKIDALGHKLSKDWLTDKDSHWHVCERCDKIFDHDDHDFPQDWHVDRKPTASKDGVKSRSCKVCDYTQTATIPYEPDLDVVPTTGDMTSQLVLGAVAVLGLLTAAVLVFKRKAVK
jgi:LPXTG-motif cell wall-anchored protein